MAQKTTVSFVDDLDGGEAEGTFQFAVDGKTFEIDLSVQNASKLRDVFAPYIGAGRRVGGSMRPIRRASASSTSREETKAIREWAAAQGMSISARGRISSEVLEAYKARDEKPAVAEPVAVEPEEVAPVKKTRSRAKAKQPEFSGAK